MRGAQVRVIVQSFSKKLTSLIQKESTQDLLRLTLQFMCAYMKYPTFKLLVLKMHFQISHLEA